MKKIAVILSFLLIVPLASISQTDPHSEDEKSVLAYMNEARTNPAGFAERYIKPHVASSEAADDCYKEMKAMEAVGPLAASPLLWKAARDHVKNNGPSGTTGHTGTDGSKFSQRIERYADWGGTIGENIQYGLSEPLDIVVDLLIDEGVPGYGHRRNILGGHFSFVGINIGPHAGYDVMCVMDFAGSVSPK